MITEFGNLNDMTLSQYETAISYFESKLEKLTNDANIEDSAKQWFLTEYGARLKMLKENKHELEVLIEEKRDSGFVNDRTATFKNLGERYHRDDSDAVFGRVQYVDPDSRFKKVMRALSVITGIGLIPTLVKLHKKKKQRLAVEDALSKENLALGKFMRKNEHPYDSVIMTKTEFTDAEKEALLENPREIARLEALMTNPALSAEEKANAKAHLIALRKFAQDKGHTLGSTTLASAGLETEKDKAEKERNVLVGKIDAVVIDDSDDLETLNKKYLELEGLKANFKPGSKNKDLKEKIIQKQNEIKSLAESIFEDKKDSTITAIDSHHTDDGYNQAALEASNRNIQTDIQNSFGVDVASLQAIANNLGLSEDANLKEVLSAYNDIKDNNNERLQPFATYQTFERKVQELKRLSESINNAIGSAGANPAIWTNINDAFESTKKLLEEIDAFAKASGLNPADISSYGTAKSEFENAQNEINKQKAKAVESSNASMIAECKNVINKPFNLTMSIVQLQEHQTNLETARRFFGSADIKNAYKNLGKESELNLLISDANNKLKLIEDMIKIKSYETYIVNNQSKLDDASLSEDEKKNIFKTLSNYAKELQEIKDAGLISDAELTSILNNYNNMITRHSSTLGGI